ncbi:MAG: PIN domain-containing protein [Candidatus Acidiferrales bacterium]
MPSSPGQQPIPPPADSSPASGHSSLLLGEKWGWLDLVVFRGSFVLLAIVATYHFRPFHLPGPAAAVIGGFLGLAGVLVEIRLRHSSLKRLIGAVVGAIAGILCAYLISLVISDTNIEVRTQSFLQVAFLLVMTYLGMIIGANKGDLLNLQALGGLFGAERAPRRHYKVLDTSVIIDGRVADISEAGFLDGILLLPQFMLRELQMVADSADPLKRNRGRRGLDMLQRIQKNSRLQTQILEDDFPHVRDVDMKLIELAKRYEAKIITNDFNLNKLAQLQGIEVLNINELANALKPIVLPGEAMRVFILKEGKEHNQGVAYLDDGTMVVVENARRVIGRTIDVTVTSVLQTTAGKMIFGRYEEGRHAERERERPANHAAASRGQAGAGSPRPSRHSPAGAREGQAQESSQEGEAAEAAPRSSNRSLTGD